MLIRNISPYTIQYAKYVNFVSGKFDRYSPHSAPTHKNRNCDFFPMLKEMHTLKRLYT